MVLHNLSHSIEIPSGFMQLHVVFEILEYTCNEDAKNDHADKDFHQREAFGLQWSTDGVL